MNARPRRLLAVAASFAVALAGALAVPTAASARSPIDTQGPVIWLDNVRDGQWFSGPPLAKMGCRAADYGSGLRAPCRLSLVKVTPAAAPDYVATWRYTARATDRAGNTTVRRGTFTIGSFFLRGMLADEMTRTVAVKVNRLYFFQTTTGGTAAPTYLFAVPSGGRFPGVPGPAGPVMSRWRDGHWSMEISFRPAAKAFSRYWNIGARLADGSVHSITLDLGPA